MTYKHGVYVSEQATGVVTPVEVDSCLPVVIGTAPVQTLAQGVTAPVNEPRLIYSYQDFIAQFGSVPDGATSDEYTLSQFAEVYLGRYGMAPVVFINVFDPATHLSEGESPAPDVSKVAAADIIGGVDSTTLKRTGLALVHEVFPRFRLVPGLICAPKFSQTPAVALAMGSACTGISGHFTAAGIIEVPDSVTKYTDAAAWLNDNNLTDANLMCMYGHGLYSGATEYGSIHLAGVIASRDAENDGIPFWSPSNKRMLCNGLTHAGKALHLTAAEASLLNGNGIVTGLNMTGGLVIWGDQTAAYPGITDVKDTSIPIRRMFNWIGNTLVLTAWQYVSSPLRRRLIETVQDTFNIWLNGLTAREFILGGRVTFEDTENPTSDLMAGKVRWHVYVTPPQAAHELDFIMEYDPDYLSTLFGAAA